MMKQVQTIRSLWGRVRQQVQTKLPAPVRQFMQRRPRLTRGLLIGLALVLVALSWRVFTKQPDRALSYYTVKRGDFLVSIAEGGSLRAVNEVTIRCEVEGTARIISIVPEGTMVKKGDLLVELDSSDIQDKLSQQEISYENAKFSFMQGEQLLSIQKSLAESNLKDAELKTTFAYSDLEKYVEGDWPQQQKVAQAKITIAEEEMQRAQDRLGWTEKLSVKGYATKTELEADKLAVTRQQIEIDQSREDLRLLEKYEYPKRKALLEASADQLKMDWGRLKQRSASQIAQAEADLEGRKRTMDLFNTRLQQLREQLALTKIYAPQDGIVVYASNGNSNYLVEEGATVRQRQELIKLPDVSQMLADVKVHETFVNQIKPGQLAYVTIDSIPDRRFVASVRRVAPLPDTQSRYLNPNVKVYSTEVVIADKLPDIKPGVSAKAEIMITNLVNVISVPLQAVTMSKGKPVVYLEGSVTPTSVEIGLSNERYVEIRSGLEPGNRVLLSPPVIADDEELVGSMVSSKEIDEARALLKRNEAHGSKLDGRIKKTDKSGKPVKRAAPNS